MLTKLLLAMFVLVGCFTCLAAITLGVVWLDGGWHAEDPVAIRFRTIHVRLLIVGLITSALLGRIIWRHTASHG